MSAVKNAAHTADRVYDVRCLPASSSGRAFLATNDYTVG